MSTRARRKVRSLLRVVLLATRIVRLGTGPGHTTHNLIVRTRLSGNGKSITAILMRGNALRMKSTVTTKDTRNHMETVVSSGKEHIGRTNPSRPIRVLNLGSIPGTKRMFMKYRSSGRTETFTRAFVSRGGMGLLRRAGSGVSLSSLFGRVRRNGLGRLSVIIGTSIRKSMRTVGRDLLGLDGSRIIIGVVRNNINTVGRSSIVLTSTSGTVVVKFGIHPSTATGSVTRHRNISLELCEIVCGTVRSMRTTVGNVLSPIFRRGILNRTRMHRAFGTSKIKAVTNTCILSNVFREGYSIHLVHSKVIMFSKPLTSLGHFGSSIGRIEAKCRYNLMFRGCGSVGRNSRIRTCGVMRARHGWRWGVPAFTRYYGYRRIARLLLIRKSCVTKMAFLCGGRLWRRGRRCWRCGDRYEDAT